MLSWTPSLLQRTSAYTGRQALELARTFRPHTLLLDIGLPDIDGYKLAEQVRATPWGA
jgi:DNA-binding response OmpR family regulator